MKRKMFVTGCALVLSFSMLLSGCGTKTDSGNSSSATKPEAKADIKYPERPINLIVPFAPGGSSDLIARAISKVSQKYLGQPLVIVNKPGGSTNIGLSELCASKPDGYTIGTANNGMVLQPLFGNSQYDYVKDLEPIVQVGRIPFVLAVSADSPWKTLEEFVKYAKENPSKIKYGHSGVGNTTHIVSEKLAYDAKIKMEPVAFDGGAKAIVALLGGHIQMTVQNPLDFKEQLKAGKIRVLAVADEKRITTDPMYKDVPTFKEKGYDNISVLWQGFGAPKGLPADVKKKLVEGMKNIINDPETKAAIQELGLVVEYVGPEDFGKIWVSDQNFYKKVLTDTGILELVKSQKK